MSSELILPVPCPECAGDLPAADSRHAEAVSTWFEERLTRQRAIWSRSPARLAGVERGRPAELAVHICRVLTHRRFNFQSRQRVAPVLSSILPHVQRMASEGRPITLFLLYNGGYRASPLSDISCLTFEPDQTELLLIFQVALLHEQISAIYPPGIEFVIVINNEVALWVNDIPLSKTTHYIRQLRGVISWLRADTHVSVLAQSECSDHALPFCPKWLTLPDALTHKEHRLVERFLGRACSPHEARQRAGLYAAAEAHWAEQLSDLAAARDALLMRQVAHPDMLSFRAFPGGAIRSQNGTLGFDVTGASLTPKLITAEGVALRGAKWIPYRPARTPNTASKLR